MKIKISLLIMLFTIFAVLTSCEEEEGENLGQPGKVSLSLTDAPDPQMVGE